VPLVGGGARKNDHRVGNLKNWEELKDRKFRHRLTKNIRRSAKEAELESRGGKAALVLRLLAALLAEELVDLGHELIRGRQLPLRVKSSRVFIH